MKPELSRFIRQGAGKGYAMVGAGMQEYDTSQIIEQPGPYHICFSRSAFLCRAAVHADGTAQLFLCDELFDLYPRCYRGCPKEMVPAAMTGIFSFDDRLFRFRLLGQPGQRVEFG